jgi:hypothetical protein
MGGPVTVIRPEDDQLHPRNDDPFWNESGWFSFSVPERKINACMYFFHRPNMKLSGGGPILFDPSGEDNYTCLYYDWDQMQPMPEGADMYHFQLHNGSYMEPIVLQKSYRLGYKNHGCEIELTWEAFTEPHEMVRIDGGINPSFPGWWADAGGQLSTGHFEQCGRMTGTVELNGETLEIDCYSLRDHTWGPRHLRPVRLAYPWAIASETSAFLAPARSEYPVEDDPFYGTTEQVTAGFYIKDGIKSGLAAGERRIVHRGNDGRPLREIIDATDELGRHLYAEGKAHNLLRWTYYNGGFDMYSLATWEFDGQTAWGEMNDYYTFAMQRRLNLAAQGKA